jgi:hypothetical protein
MTKEIHPEGVFEARIRDVLNLRRSQVGEHAWVLTLRVKTEHGKLFVPIYGGLNALQLIASNFAAYRNKYVLVGVKHRLVHGPGTSAAQATLISGGLLP